MSTNELQLNSIPSSCRAVIFDLDGTLLNTLPDLTASINHSLAIHGYDPITPDQVRRCIGWGSSDRMMQIALPGGLDNPDAESVQKVMGEYYAVHCADLTAPYPGVLNAMQQLLDAGYMTAIVSNKPDPNVKILANKYFGSLCSLAVGSSPKVRRKPAPDSLLAALEELQIPLEEAVYVGDSEVDIETARNAGLPCICVTWGFRPESELIEQGAQILVHNTAEMLQLFGLEETV